MTIEELKTLITFRPKMIIMQYPYQYASIDKKHSFIGERDELIGIEETLSHQSCLEIDEETTYAIKVPENIEDTIYVHFVGEDVYMGDTLYEYNTTTIHKDNQIGANDLEKCKKKFLDTYMCSLNAETNEKEIDKRREKRYLKKIKIKT